MAFFSNGEDKLKLMILFTLECAEMPLSREQIATVMSENGVENYFDVCEHIIDLEANGCIASVPTFKMQMIVMTPRGEEIMNLFGKNLPKSLRESIEGFVGSNKDEFRRENTSRIITTPLPDGGFDATFALVENGDAIFEIRIKLPNAEYTRLAEKKLGGSESKNIYRYAACACEDVSECAKLGCSRNLRTEQYIVLGGSFVFSRNGL